MIKTTAAYKAAIVGPRREILLRASVNIVDPDMIITGVDGSSQAPWSDSDHLSNRQLSAGPRYATLEPGRWSLDGTCRLIPDSPRQLSGEVGYVSSRLCDEAGIFSSSVWAELKVSQISVLQACSIFFSGDPVDGVAEDFRVEIYSAGQRIWYKEYTGNRAIRVNVEGFTVQAPDAIRVLVKKWSLPRRRMRVLEIIPGLYEEWGGDMIATMEIRHLGNFADLAIPYGTCNLVLNNKARRFEPFSKVSLFASIKERQQIPIRMGVKLPDGSVEWVPVGTYYQASNGWKTGQNDLSLTWQLVDIIGLLAQRDFIVPDVLPTTLGGWLQALVDQLGKAFHGRWHADPAYVDRPATVTGPEALAGQTCGSILRFVCMATGTWPRAGQETGDLTAEPFWSEGVALKPSAMPKSPVKKANKELAALIFKLDGDQTEVVSGTSTSSSDVLTVNNPFIHTREQALTAARQILSQYGGLTMEAVSRGDMSSEIGDVDTVWISASEARTGRRMSQTLKVSGGILKNAQATLLQADGSLLYEGHETITMSGMWDPPPGVDTLRVILGQGGTGGEDGEDGRTLRDDMGYPARAPSGAQGQGGKILAETIHINPGQRIQVQIGAGSASVPHGQTAAEGGETTFANLSTATGKRYPTGYTDIASGRVYGRSGVEAPAAGSGDGGMSGRGGYNGSKTYLGQQPIYNDQGDIIGYEPRWDYGERPTKGTKATSGASGFAVVYWDKAQEVAANV